MKKIFLLAALASTMLASCSNDDSVADSKVKNDQLSIVVGGIGTKAIKAGPKFDTNDKIGVFVTGTGYTSAVTEYTYGGSEWTPTTLDKGIKLTGNKASVFAFYPSTLTLSASPVLPDATSTFDITVPATDDFAATATPDCLWATGTDVSNLTSGTSNVSTMTFHHSLAKISFVFVSDGNYPVTNGSGKLYKIKFDGSNLITRGTVKVGTGEFTPDLINTASSVEYTPKVGSEPIINANGSSVVTAYAMVAPINYNITGGSFELFVTIDGKEILVGGFPLLPNWSDAGLNYVYTITVSPSELKVSSSTIIKDWEVTNIGGLVAN